jgi:peptidoglycan DL-endopeptidase CwlO
MQSSPRRLTPLRASVVAIVGLLTFSVATPAVGAQSVDTKRAEASSIAERLADLESKQMDLAADFERANYELSKAEEKVAETQRYVDEATAELEQRRAEVRKFAVEAYQTGGSDRFDAIMKGELNEAPQAQAYIEVTSGSRRDLVDQLNAAKERAAGEIERLDDARAEAEAHAGSIESARRAAADAVGEQRALQNRVQGELASLVAEEQQRQAEAAAAAAAVAAPSTSASTAPGASTAPAPTTPPATVARPVAPAPLPAPTPTNPAPSPVRRDAAAAIPYATSKVGSAYVWGAAGPNVFDCSGLMVWAFAQVGISLPHYSGAIYNMTTRISASQLQPGDFVFWGGGGSDHVALYMGGNQLIHAFGSGGTRITALQGWWKPPSGYGRLR